MAQPPNGALPQVIVRNALNFAFGRDGSIPGSIDDPQCYRVVFHRQHESLLSYECNLLCSAGYKTSTRVALHPILLEIERDIPQVGPSRRMFMVPILRM